MPWKKHLLGPASLPQKCARCGEVLIDVGGHAEPLEQGQILYANEEPDRTTIALTIPADEAAHAEACSK